MREAGACSRSLVDFGQAEVQAHDVAGRQDHHVAGLEIAVNDSLFVRGFERFSNLLRDLLRLIHRECTVLQSVRQGLPLNKLHRNTWWLRGIFETVDLRNTG